jgi:hypothetical protein
LVVGTVDVEDRVARAGHGDDRPRSPAVDGREDLVRSAPPIDGRDDGMVGVGGVHADAGIAPRTTPRPDGRGHVGPGQVGGVELPDLACGDAVGPVAAAVVDDPEIAVAAQAGVGSDHVRGSARDETPVGSRVGGAVHVAIARTHSHNAHVEGGRGRTRCAVRVEDHPAQPVTGVAVYRKRSYL